MINTNENKWAVVSKADGFVYGLYGTRQEARDNAHSAALRVVKTEDLSQEVGYDEEENYLEFQQSIPNDFPSDDEVAAFIEEIYQAVEANFKETVMKKVRQGHRPLARAKQLHNRFA